MYGHPIVSKGLSRLCKEVENEFLFIRGIDKCFEYFYTNFEDFINERIPREKVDDQNGRINEIRDKFEREKKVYKYKTKDKFFDLNDIKYAYTEIMKKLFFRIMLKMIIFFLMK